MTKRGTSYFGNRFLDHFKRDLEEIISFPFQYIIHTFSENDLMYYQDTLREFVQYSKLAGLEVYIDPWGVGKIFGGEAFSNFISKYPQDCQVLSSGRRVPAACPNSSGFKEFMLEWVESAILLGGDVIFWDEPHFFIDSSLAFKNPDAYQDWACRCQKCQSKFKEQTGLTMGNVLTPEIIRFREISLIEFLKELCQIVKSKGLRNAVCLLPVPISKFSIFLGIDDWSRVAELSEVDILSTDPYWSIFQRPVSDFVGDYSKKIVELSKRFNKESEIWIQAFKIPSGKEDEVLKAIEIAYSENPSKIAVWSYRATSCMSQLRCDNSDLVWKKVREGFNNIKGKNVEIGPVAT